jgi:GWxTD domain-containing protein
MVDAARFRGGDDMHTNVEVYYSVPRRGLTYVPDSAGHGGGADVTLWVTKKDSIVLADRWLVPQTIRDTANAPRGMNLVGNYAFQLSAGEYLLKILVRDRHNPARRDSSTVRLPIAIVPTGAPAFSDIEFASSIRQSANPGAFTKNTLDVVPSVGGIFTEDQRCYYYAEAYNLLAGEDRGDFFLRATVQDAVGKEMIARERPKRRGGESSVLVDHFGVESLRSGTYLLHLTLLDTARKQLATTARKFYVYNSKLGVDSTLLASGSSMPLAEYMSMDESELDREFRWSTYEAGDVEKGQYKSLGGAEAKRKFLSDFWRKRYPGSREEYLARVAYANQNFQVMTREGYRSDRGRVHITYGVPDDVERHPNETESRPYEIWSYNNIQGGVIFVFVLKNAGGDYELVHSTHRNELHDENWDRVGITR